MQEAKLGHSNLIVSEFCLGCMGHGDRVKGRDTAALIDSFRDQGGNFFDTAHCYAFWRPCGDGASERELGRYISENNCRDSVVIATKGAHPGMENYRKVEQYISPCRVASDIDDSLARLRTDVIDLYWLHRDDPRMPVGEIVDILNVEVRRGRIRYFGGSNWTAARLDEANVYAAEHGVEAFVASQPKWSLLEYDALSEEKRLEPGVLLHLNAEDRRRHTASQLPVIPYGPTGNGFFAFEGREPERFVNNTNTARAGRAVQLAEELGATPNQVALAWLLAQPFPVLPILGSCNLDHLRDGLTAASISLSQQQVAWLEQG